MDQKSLKKQSFKSHLKRERDIFYPLRERDIFYPLHGHFSPSDPQNKKIRISHKLNVEYGVTATKAAAQPHSNSKASATENPQKKGVPKNELAVGPSLQPKDGFSSERERNLSTAAIMERIPSKWHPPSPWKNYRVMSGHLGWVRSVAVDHNNSLFCTGSADRTIKIWDLATGTLKLTLTGHIQQIRGLAVRSKDTHTHIFSAGDDKQVRCWDVEQNKTIRSYHGHLSGVHCLALHPTSEDIILTGGRDCVCRVWDNRTKMQIHALSGHDNTICSVLTRSMDPQVITASHDSTIKFWDLRYGTTMATLTHHKKSVRAMALHPKEDAFVSASADNIKKFNLPRGEFLHNMLSQQKTTINAMAVNDGGVVATGGDNGSLWFWDWRSGHNFQQAQTIVQPGSLETEAGIYALTYDVTGTRLITCEADKTIKMWKQDDNVTPQTHPLHFNNQHY